MTVCCLGLWLLAMPVWCLLSNGLGISLPQFVCSAYCSVGGRTSSTAAAVLAEQTACLLLAIRPFGFRCFVGPVWAFLMGSWWVGGRLQPTLQLEGIDGLDV
jgi:hypothetical protein